MLLKFVSKHANRRMDDSRPKTIVETRRGCRKHLLGRFGVDGHPFGGGFGLMMSTRARYQTRRLALVVVATAAGAPGQERWAGRREGVSQGWTRRGRRDGRQWH